MELHFFTFGFLQVNASEDPNSILKLYGRDIQNQSSAYSQDARMDEEIYQPNNQWSMKPSVGPI